MTKKKGIINNIRDRLRQVGGRGRTRRRAGRLKTTLPVVMEFGGESGITRDVSLSGVLLEMDTAYAVGSTVHFVIEHPTASGMMAMESTGTVIRVEKLGNKFGVAVKLLSQRLKSVS